MSLAEYSAYIETAPTRYSVQPSPRPRQMPGFAACHEMQEPDGEWEIVSCVIFQTREVAEQFNAEREME